MQLFNSLTEIRNSDNLKFLHLYLKLVNHDIGDMG